MLSALGLWEEAEDAAPSPARAGGARGGSESGDPVSEGWSALQAVSATFNDVSAAIGGVFDTGAAVAAHPDGPPKESQGASRSARSMPPTARCRSPSPSPRSIPPRARCLSAPFVGDSEHSTEPGGAQDGVPSVPGGQLRKLINGHSSRCSSHAVTPTLLGRGAASGDPHREAASLLLGPLLVEEEPKCAGATREPPGARAVQWRQTNSCFSDGGTKTHEDLSDRQQRPARQTGSCRRRRPPGAAGRRLADDRGGGKDEAADMPESSSGSGMVSSFFQQLYQGLAGGGSQDPGRSSQRPQHGS